MCPISPKNGKCAIRVQRKSAWKFLKDPSYENWEAKRFARNEETRLRRKEIRKYWNDQSAKLTSKPNEV